MDHIGRKLSTSLALDSKDDTRFCHLCPYARASAYCVDCWIYLCPRCKGQHKKYPAFKNHQLLKGEEMSSLYATEHGTRTDDMDKCSDFISSTGLASSTAVRPPGKRTFKLDVTLKNYLDPLFVDTRKSNILSFA